MSEALRAASKKVYVCNIMTYEGETRGYNLPDFLKAIDDHTYPHRVYDYVLVNNGTTVTRAYWPLKTAMRIKFNTTGRVRKRADPFNHG